MRLVALTGLILTSLLCVTPLTAMAAGTISVVGTASVNAPPDMAIVTAGVVSQSGIAREALDSNSRATAALIATLEEQGVAAGDIQTSGFSVSPNYVYSDQRDANGYSRPPQINGYIVTNGVTVRVRDLSKLGAVLDLAISVGANSINGISFSVADPAAHYQEARRLAFADAIQKAQTYAQAADTTLGPVASISESQGFSSSPMPMYAAREMVAESVASVPVSAGELAFSVNVNATWTIAE